MPPIYRLIFGLTVLPFLASNVAAQIPAEEYAARRDSLAARMGHGVLVAFGAPNPVTYEFQLRQLPAFNYLTGFLEPNAAMVLIHGDDGVRHTLFTERPTVRTPAVKTGVIAAQMPAYRI